METTRALKVAFTGKKFVPTRNSEGKLTYGTDGNILGLWDDKIYTKTYSIDESLVAEDIKDADPETGEVPALVFKRIYDAAYGLLRDGLINLNGITPVLQDGETAGSPFEPFLPNLTADKVTQVVIYWEVKNILPVVSA